MQKDSSGKPVTTGQVGPILKADELRKRCLAAWIVTPNLSNHDMCPRIDWSSTLRIQRPSATERKAWNPIIWSGHFLTPCIDKMLFSESRCARSPWPLVISQMSAKDGGARSRVSKKKSALWSPCVPPSKSGEKQGIFGMKSHLDP